MLNFGQKKTFL
ncbi:hypothetical protein [African swine fever virus]